MRKLCYLFLALLPILSACPSNDDDTLPKIEDSDYFIEFKVDGNFVRYEPKMASTMGFSYQPDYGIYVAAILVMKDESVGTKNFVNLNLKSNEPFKLGNKYDLQDVVNVQGTPQTTIIFSYTGEDGVLYHALLLKKAHESLPINDEFFLTFTDLGENVAGTFSGKIFKSNSAITASRPGMDITEGKFRLKKLDL